MPERAIWRGVLKIGAERLNVKLYSAARERKIALHLLHSPDEARLSQRMVCSMDGAAVAPQDKIRGFPASETTYVIAKPGELEMLEPEESRDIKLLKFVPAGSLDSRLFGRSYLLKVDSNSEIEKYYSLTQALINKKRAGICKWVMRKSAYTAALVPGDDGLYLVSIRPFKDLIQVRELGIQKIASDERAAKTAKYLIEALSSGLEIDREKNEYLQKMRELLGRKARGLKPQLRPLEPPKATESDQLVAALEASVIAARKRKGEGVGRDSGQN